MSASGYKQTLAGLKTTSALHPGADLPGGVAEVPFLTLCGSRAGQLPAKGNLVDDRAFVGIDGEAHLVGRFDSLKQRRGSDHEAHLHHRNQSGRSWAKPAMTGLGQERTFGDTTRKVCSWV